MTMTFEVVTDMHIISKPGAKDTTNMDGKLA